MRVAVFAVLVLAFSAVASARELQQVAAPAAATLTIDFDNSIREVTKSKRDAVVLALAKHVFQCKLPLTQGGVVLSGGMNTGILLGDESVVTFRATCRTANGRSVYDNCVANTKRTWLGFGSSVAQKEVKKATDTWWPNDSVDIQKATCSQG